MSSVVWFRQDLRLADNPALEFAASKGPVIGLYVLDETAPPDGRPLGKPADKATRTARTEAHDAFDPLWKGKGATMSRGEAYDWLAEQTGIRPIHIGELDQDQCARVVEICEDLVEGAGG